MLRQNTDAHFRAEILTYVEAVDLFAGVSLQGHPSVRMTMLTKRLYGREIDAELLLTGTDMGIPSDAAEFMSTLRRLAGQ